MAYDPRYHHRRSIRLSGYDYGLPGTYFITICTHNRICLFGDIVDGRMHLSAAGQIVEREWRKSADLRHEIRLDAFVVMPNHVHGVVGIVGMIQPTDAQGADCHPPLQRASRSLSSFVAGFKGAVTREINRQRASSDAVVWQRGYYDHIVRSTRALDAIRHYILTNPQRWSHDAENPSGDGTDTLESFLTTIDVSTPMAEKDSIDEFITFINPWHGHTP